MQILVLRFDYKSSAIIESLQNQAVLAARTSKRQLPPHLTLQTFQHVNLNQLKQIAEDTVPKLANTTLRFSSLGFFKKNGTFFLSPASSKVLLNAYFDIQSAARELRGQSLQYGPDAWVPYITVINDIAPPFWGPMFARLSLEFEPFEAKAAAVECWTVTDTHIETDWSLFLS